MSAEHKAEVQTFRLEVVSAHQKAAPVLRAVDLPRDN